MQYLGGKSKIAKRLAAYLESRREGRYFVEPFCGALNITAAVKGPRLACDASPYLFSLYRAAREGWEPPLITEQLYAEVKAKKDPTDPLTAPFDHEAFWLWVRNASEQATVLVSEYRAPADFRCVWEMQAPGDMQGKDKATGRTERLFEWAP